MSPKTDNRGFFEKLLDLGNDALDAAGVAREEGDERDDEKTPVEVPTPRRPSHGSQPPPPRQSYDSGDENGDVTRASVKKQNAFNDWFESWYNDSHTLKTDYRIFCEAAWLAGYNAAMADRMGAAARKIVEEKPTHHHHFSTDGNGEPTCACGEVWESPKKAPIEPELVKPSDAPPKAR